MDDAGKTYADLTDEEKAVFYEYLEITEDKKAVMDAAFVQLSADGTSLFESMLLVEMMADGLFTLAEAQTLAVRYSDRAVRDGQISGFRSFTAAFTKPDEILAASMIEAKPKALVSEEVTQLRTEKAQYLTASAFAQAKDMFLSGSDIASIKAAFSVAAALELNPADLLLNDTTENNSTVVSAGSTIGSSINVAAPSAEETEFLSKFPVNLAAVRVQLNTLASTAATGQNVMSMETLADEALTMQSALYSTLALDTDSGRYGDDSNLAFPPFLADLSGSIGVELNTGSAVHDVDLVNLPGINGHDLRIGVRYSSDRANFAQVTPSGVNSSFLVAYVDHVSYLMFQTILVKYSENTIMQQVADLTAANAFFALYPIGGSVVETISATPTHTVTVDDYQISQTIITGTYTPFAITSNVATEAPASIAYSQNGFSGTLLPYRSYTAYNSGIVQTGDNTWQHIIQVRVDYSGNVTASTNQILHTYPNSGVQTIVVYNSASSIITNDELNTAIGNGWLWNLPEIYLDTVSGSPYAFLYIPEKGTLQFSTTLADGATTYR